MKLKAFIFLSCFTIGSLSWAAAKNAQAPRDCVTNQWFIRVNEQDQSNKEDLLKVFEVLGQFHRHGVKIDNVSPLKPTDGPARQMFVRYTPANEYNPITKKWEVRKDVEVRHSFVDALESIPGIKILCFGTGAVSGGN